MRSHQMNYSFSENGNSFLTSISSGPIHFLSGVVVVGVQPIAFLDTLPIFRINRIQNPDDQLIRVTNIINKGFASKLYTVGVFLDVKRAVDKM
ncbi:hypothetical protein TNCV_2735041 [Trichonephila clavipes]|nr:hypothetical protein TNCV_2735041 [Trichonephila clavipes]